MSLAFLGIKQILSFKDGYRDRTKCHYRDFYIDGQRLADLLKVGDFIPPLGWLKPDVELCFIEMLLRKRESDLKPNRVPLFVCPECVDYGCGVETCQMKREGHLIVWSDFGFETDYSDERQPSGEFVFQFDAKQYWQAFQEFDAGR